MPRLRPKLTDAPLSAFGKTVPARPLNPSKDQPQDYHLDDGKHAPHTPEVDRTYKLYIGGKQARPDAVYARSITGPTGKVLAQVCE
jgi:aldehyde dehydrogenase (NAD+)